MNSDPKPALHGKSVHGHTGPTTPAEYKMRNAYPAVAPPGDRAKIAEEASRQEDA